MQAVATNIGVGLTHLDNLRSAANHHRFVVLKGADFQFSTLAYIIFSRTKELSPLAQEFLSLVRQAKRLPKGKNVDEVAAATNWRVKNLVLVYRVSRHW